MEILTMGKVVVSAKIENLADAIRLDAGDISDDQVRTIEVDDALVDTGATFLSLPKRQIAALGLKLHRTRTARTAGGVMSFGIYEAVRLTVQDRDCVIEVCELPDSCPPLIGQIPLEALDFVVDPVGQKLIGNPDHNGEQMIEIF
jgi:predicted aspartyl protease